MRARQASAPRQARLEPCSLAHVQEGVQEAIEKTVSAAKEQHFFEVLSKSKWELDINSLVAC